eukprot:1373874-Amorphochlora_amoeboformis.AAC.2
MAVPIVIYGTNEGLELLYVVVLGDKNNEWEGRNGRDTWVGDSERTEKVDIISYREAVLLKQGA